jgi:uncharacterized lipoprotein YddW (UPF0748 family)
VRQYLVDVFREIVEKYEVDGLHLDYIRFPNEPVVSGERIPDYPRDKRTLALYRAATGLHPDENPAKWNRWRADQVSNLVRDIRAMVKATRPDAALTAAVGANPERSKVRYFRDSRRWVHEGWLDTVYPMNYSDNLQTFSKGIQNWSQVPTGVTVVQGIGVWRLEKPAALLAHVRTAEESNGHFCLFSYKAFFPSAVDPAKGVDARTTKLREMRRNTLRKHIQTLESGGDPGPANDVKPAPRAVARER